ncbi:MAG: FliI/YscN family ATPase [Planctomycetota bacterium]
MSALAEQIEFVRTTATLGVTGRVQSLSGMTVQAVGLPVPVGSLCEIEIGSGTTIPAEVIGFRQSATLLMPLLDAGGLTRGQRVRHVTSSQKVAVGPGLLGRVVNGMGVPCDGGPPIACDRLCPVHHTAPDAMTRLRIDRPMSVGVRSINALLTPGCGQRLGIFAGTGVGKSVILGMMARHTSADVTVVALVGERGREVGDFIRRDLGTEGLKRSVLVVSTSDQSPPLRVRACFVATAIAEYFRDQGANVLLLMDSVTRMAMAGRQIGLAAGEPPATKGYPPSVFAMLPRLLERSGRTNTGSITGLYTVLVEGDDINEPISDATRGILDGHIWLSRRLANKGQYPAVSVLESVSRVMPDVVDAAHLAAAAKVRRILATWGEIEDLVNIGAYATGSNPEFDLVIRMRPAVEAFLRQGMTDGIGFDEAHAALMKLSAEIDTVEASLAQSGRASARTAKS